MRSFKPLDAVAKVVDHLVNGDNRKATAFLSPSLTVKGSRRHRGNRRSRYAEIVLTIGAPNFAERQFIRLAKKAGEPFPIRKIQLKPWKAA